MANWLSGKTEWRWERPMTMGKTKTNNRRKET